jgi:hypothetical protein
MLINADKSGKTDGTAHNFLQRMQTDVPVVLVSRVQDFEYNDAIDELIGKKWVLVDYVENGWDWDMNESHEWGINTKSHFGYIFPGEQWMRFDNFVKYNPPALILQRELLKSQVSDTVKPISYPCWYEIPPVQSRDEFLARPLEVMFTWGLSHEGRKVIHSDIWRKAGEHGYSVCDNIYYLNYFLQHESHPKKWFTANIPHYARVPMEEILKVNGISKISISPAGAGRGCFRHAESPINSVMLMWNDWIAWPYEWKEGENCLKCYEGFEIQAIIKALNQPDKLYEIYLSGVETCKKYYWENYINDYILPLINKA